MVNRLNLGSRERSAIDARFVYSTGKGSDYLPWRTAAHNAPNCKIVRSRENALVIVTLPLHRAVNIDAQATAIVCARYVTPLSSRQAVRGFSLCENRISTAAADQKIKASVGLKSEAESLLVQADIIVPLAQYRLRTAEHSRVNPA